MKHEGMPTQRLEAKRVEERVGEGERERGREREREKARARRRERERKRERASKRVRERERERALATPFICFPPPGPALCKLGLARSAVSST